MPDLAEPTASSGAELRGALLDYFNAPGNYELGLRRPAALFASTRAVLQAAVGRGAAAEDREAALFFIRAALLYPGADHYTVLGLPAGQDPVELKERYRLLMRLIHPDLAAGGPSPWPADAVVRVNRAYDVLSSPVLRRAYDEQLARAWTVTGRAGGASTRAVVRLPALGRRKVRSGAGKAAVWALATSGCLLAAGTLLPGSEPIDLVQRPPAAAKPVTTAPAGNAARPAPAQGVD